MTQSISLKAHFARAQHITRWRARQKYLGLAGRLAFGGAVLVGMWLSRQISPTPNVWVDVGIILVLAAIGFGGLAVWEKINRPHFVKWGFGFRNNEIVVPDHSRINEVIRKLQNTPEGKSWIKTARRLQKDNMLPALWWDQLEGLTDQPAQILAKVEGDWARPQISSLSTPPENTHE